MTNAQPATTTPLVVPTDLTDVAARKRYIREHSYAIPSEVALDVIKLVSPTGVVEIGAGGGYWAQLLRERGVQVEAFDLDPVPLPGPYYVDRPNLNRFADRAWGLVQQGDAVIAGNYSASTLMLCWPQYDSSMAYDAVDCYKGDTLVYIGEWRSATRDTSGEEWAFFGLLEEEWTMVREVAIPQWESQRDTLTIWRRKAPLQPLTIVEGPLKDWLISSLTDEIPAPVVFVPEFGDPIAVLITSLERESGSGQTWNFTARLVGKNEYVRGHYNTRTRRGNYRPSKS